MKHFIATTLGAGFLLVCIGSTAALAQGDQHKNGGPGAGQDQRPPAAEQHAAPPQHTIPQDHAMGPPQMQYAHPGQHPIQHQQASGQWHKGNRYNGNRRVIYQGDWDRYHLRQPPHGYEWIQDGNQFVLIAITSGIVAEVILNSMNR